MPGGLAGGGREGRDPAESGERGLGAESLGIVTGHHQERSGHLGTDPAELEQSGGMVGQQGHDHLIDAVDLCGQRLMAQCQEAQGPPGGRRGGVEATDAEPASAADQLHP